MHISCIFICMRTTLNIDDEVLKKASNLTGIREKTSLVLLGLKALISQASNRRLADLGAMDKFIRPIRRRRTDHGPG